jgi:hypothetical protein
MAPTGAPGFGRPGGLRSLQEANMRNLLAFSAAAALTVAGLGWYLDWYKIQATPSTNGHRNVEIDIDTNKMTQDVHKGGEQILENGGQRLQQSVDKTGKHDNGQAIPSILPAN